MARRPGVASIDDALRELELRPFHDALRTANEPAALAEAAALLEIEPLEAPVAPGVERAIAATDERTLGRSIEALVAAAKPEMARGKWIYDWLVDRVWENADLVALMLDFEARPRSGRGTGRKPRELLADDRFRRSIGVNEHDGVTWFNRERFEHAVTWLALPNAADLTSAAQTSGYRLDRLDKLLAAPPKWASTTSAAAAHRASGGKSTGAGGTGQVRDAEVGGQEWRVIRSPRPSWPRSAWHGSCRSR